MGTSSFLNVPLVTVTSDPAYVYRRGQIGELDPVSIIRAHTAFFILYQGKILRYAFF
jgi:hypothetical protein